MPTDCTSIEQLNGADALELLKTAEKPNPQLSDADWTATKNDFMGQTYFALGCAAAYANKMDDVAADFQKSGRLTHGVRVS